MFELYEELSTLGRKLLAAKGDKNQMANDVANYRHYQSGNLVLELNHSQDLSEEFLTVWYGAHGVVFRDRNWVVVTPHQINAPEAEPQLREVLDILRRELILEQLADV